ncbi:type II toxin-antitoxin system VapC family toxin [Methylococcus sp. EFPC2]|uniref:type II toxin-antitoxin system VapC family toxin n=1 Tax=Methylococcus sp. EFPC2 TaxID=2812648 RepID=UPI001F085D07|nr:type II toxin-antitoxin system VapC family toxin [Methylococcus sp. EFPC2]
MLDTDIASYVIKGRSPVVEAKLMAIVPSMVCISAVTRAELMYGLKRLPAGHRLQLAVRQFLKIVRVLSWDAEAADYYADIRHQLVSSGQPIGEMDMMIAAHSLSAGSVLVTNNVRHYSRIEAPLTLVNWA